MEATQAFKGKIEPTVHEDAQTLYEQMVCYLGREEPMSYKSFVRGLRGRRDYTLDDDTLTEFLAAFVTAESDAEVRALLTQNKSLLEVAEQRLGDLFSNASVHSQESADELRKVLRDAKALGIERAVANRRALLDDRKGKSDVVSEFLKAETNHEEYELLRNHPLLSAPANERQLRNFLEITRQAPGDNRAFEKKIVRKLAAIERFRRSPEQ